MKKTFKRYKSLFDSERKSKSSILKEAKSKLFKVKKILRSLREEDEVEAEEVTNTLETAIDQIEDVLTTVIDSVGATDPSVSTLIDTVSDLETQSDIADFEVDEEEFEFTEAEEDDDEEEEEDEDEKEDEEEDTKKEESVKKSKIKLSKYKK